MDTHDAVQKPVSEDDAQALVEREALLGQRVHVRAAVDHLVASLGSAAASVATEVRAVYSALQVTPLPAPPLTGLLSPEVQAERLERLQEALAEWSDSRHQLHTQPSTSSLRAGRAASRLELLVQLTLPALAQARLAATAAARGGDPDRADVLAENLGLERERRAADTAAARRETLEYAAHHLSVVSGISWEAALKRLEGAPAVASGEVCADSAALRQASSEVWHYMLQAPGAPSYHEALKALARLERTAHHAIARKSLVPALMRVLRFLDTCRERHQEARDDTGAAAFSFYATLLREACGGRTGPVDTSPAEAWLLDALRMQELHCRASAPALPPAQTLTTARQAARAYLGVVRTLTWLDVAASEFISRSDNRGVFEVRWWLRDVARRILRGYDGVEERLAPSATRGVGIDPWREEGARQEAHRWRESLLSLPDIARVCAPYFTQEPERLEDRTHFLLLVGAAFRGLHGQLSMAGAHGATTSDAGPGQALSAERMDRALSANVRHWRGLRGVSLDAAAAQAGISSKTWALVERGRVSPTVRTLVAMARVLAVSPADLLKSSAREEGAA